MKKKNDAHLSAGLFTNARNGNGFGNQTTWTRGWGQGVSEFVINGEGQSQLSLTCEDYDSQPATVIFTDASGHQVSMDGDKSLQVSIDGGAPIDISESESRVGGNNLALAWTQLRNGKQVSVTGDGAKPATFTLAGRIKVNYRYSDARLCE